jgi:hypothetical protein
MDDLPGIELIYVAFFFLLKKTIGHLDGCGLRTAPRSGVG